MKDQIPTQKMLMIVHEHLLEMSHRCVKESLALNYQDQQKAEDIFQYGLAFHCVAALIHGANAEMKTCSTCKYWGTGPGLDRAKNLRPCACPKNCTGYNVHDVPDDGMLAEDDEGWGFGTGPNFGCVNYESK